MVVMLLLLQPPVGTPSQVWELGPPLPVDREEEEEEAAVAVWRIHPAARWQGPSR
jgi:hypothetical protein